MDMFDFAGMLFGGSRTAPDATTVTATGAGASEDGEVGITLDADVTPAEDTGVDGETDQTVIDLPTSPDVDEGDELIVTLVGDGPLKTPVVTANPGSGDRMRALANSAKTIANAAQAVAEAVSQHFFADTNGIHVTEATQEDWDESHTGANVLINSIGQLFRDGLNNLLTLTTENGARALTIWDGLGNAAGNIRAIIGAVIQLGKTDESHVMLDYHSMQMVDGDGNIYLHVSDLRDESGLIDQEWLMSMANDQATTSWSLTLEGATQVYSVTDTDGAALAFTATAVSNGMRVSFTTAEASTSVFFYVRYRGPMRTGESKAYTLGYRMANSDIGVMSLVEGMNNTASGWAAHAEGFMSSATGAGAHAEGGWSNGWLTSRGGTASGKASHAQNTGTVAASDDQTAMGRYNDNSADHALEIGNGTNDSHRSNAFAVGWDGTVECAGDVTASGNVSGATINGLPYPAPCGTYTGANGTATASAAGWQLTYFNTVVAEFGSPRTYDYTFSNGVLTAKRDCVLEISGVMNWTDAIAGNKGFGIFSGTTVGSGTEASSFQNFPSGVSNRKSVVFPPKLFKLSAGSSLTFGRYQQQGAVYQNGTNFSWVTIRVVG
jgi:hypothetical protein